MGSVTQASSNRIVVGVDMSETGDNALREAMRLCRLVAGTELHVTSIIPTESDLHDARRIEQLSNEMRVRIDQLRGHVQSVCAPAPGGEPFTQEIVFHVRLGAPAAAIHQLAVDVDADLIVVGTHARRGLAKLILGSVADELIRTAHVPVVVAHPKELRELKHSDRPEARRPGEDLGTGGLTNRLHIQFMPAATHISGLV
jgi:nucleotide-binding universal stress UspA family protein